MRANGQTTLRGPLDAWARKLGGLRRPLPSRTDALVNAALRSVLLFGIGALHGAPRKITHTLSAEEAAAGAIPNHARDVLPLGDRFVWTETEPYRWPEMSHPEWTAAIWARARVALLDNAGPGASQRRVGMLHVPAATVVACFTDSIYLTEDPHWLDDGRAGRYRRVWADHDRGLPLPETAAELRRRKGESS
jgi:hypothetical protein